MNQIIKQVYGFLLLAGLLAGPACQEVSEPHTSSLSLSQTEPLRLSSQSSQASITVMASSGHWVALADVEWVHTTKLGNTLRLSVEANPSTDMRQASIQISSGSQTEVLKLEQSGSPLEFKAQQSIRFGQFGGEKRFYVDASAPSWQVFSSEEWVKVTPYTLQGEIGIKVSENTNRDGRTAKVEVKDASGKLVHTLSVEQSPILYLVMPHPEFGVSSEVIRLFETDRYSRLVNQPDGRGNLFNWGYETVSPIFDYIIYRIKNGKYVGASVYSANRNPDNLRGAIGREVQELLVRSGYKCLLEQLYYREETNTEVNIVTSTRNPNITFTSYPDQEPYASFGKLPIGLSKFYLAKLHANENSDEDPVIEVLKEGASAQEIMDYERQQGWTMIPHYDPTDPQNAGDSPEVRERKRDESSRKIRVPLFFGAKNSNPDHWREYYIQLVFERDGQYRQYEMARTYEDYINDYIDPSDPLYGTKSRRVSGTALTTTRETFKDPRQFFYWDDNTASLYVTREFRLLLAQAGFMYSSTLDAGRAFTYYNADLELELMFRIGKTLVEGDNKPSVVVVQVAPRLRDGK